MAQGPDPDFIEPGGGIRAEEFSTCTESGAFPCGKPETYACGKATAFPNEGGPVILSVEVPDNVVALALDEEGCFPLWQGLVPFNEGAGLEELRSAWPTLPM